MLLRSLMAAVCLEWIAGAGAFALANDPQIGGAAPAATPPDAEAGVRAALCVELDGKNAERNSLLRQALEQAPDFPQAHWHLGHVRVDGRWMPYDRVSDTTGDRWQKWYLYRKHRDERADTVVDHFVLADFARDWAMPDEERSHLTRIVELDWANEEARRRLGDVKIDGFWVPREEAEAFAARLTRTRHDLDTWAPRIDQIIHRPPRTRQSTSGDAANELLAIRDPSAIPAVEAACAAGNDRMVQHYLEWLRGLDVWEASVALARQAVLSPSSSVRSSAQQSLRQRRIDEYAPVLLGALRADTKFQSRLSVTPFGGLLYVEECAVESQYDHRVRRLAVLYGVQVVQFDFPIDGRPAATYHHGLQNVASPGRREVVIDHLHRYYGGFTSREGRDRLSHVTVNNDRIMRTLSAATGFSVPDSPQDWWEWWNVYQAVHVDGAKPLRESQYQESWYVDRKPRRTATLVTRSGGPYSCFAGGTTVVTESGSRPIEEIQLGDRVLSQDVESGELAFKPVFKTTVRPPAPLLKITTDRGELICTGGHPFWVNGENWLYARELQPGMRFHAVDGASEIHSVENAGRQERAYNLIVADFHTYFVGNGRILSHDNTPRAPTNALVPGLMPDYASTGAGLPVTMK